jgi:hypothetical protein
MALQPTLPPFKPPSPRPNTSYFFDKPISRARRSHRKFHLFPYNCSSRLPPRESKAACARFRLASKAPHSPNAVLLLRPDQISYRRSPLTLRSWRFLSYELPKLPPLGASVSSSPSTALLAVQLNGRATIYSRRRKLRPSHRPPAKRRRLN